MKGDGVMPVWRAQDEAIEVHSHHSSKRLRNSSLFSNHLRNSKTALLASERQHGHSWSWVHSRFLQHWHEEMHCDTSAGTWAEQDSLFHSQISDSVVLSFDSVGHTIGSEYDKLGFLLNLDSKLPPELASKYANFSEGMCKPGYASTLMTVIFPKFSKPAPMFLDDSFRKWARIRDFVPPFGIKGQDNLIKAILSATKDYRLTPALDSLSCRRCIIVGNGGVLANKSLGLKIDDYDVVVRLNSAPVKGFEKDVGGKTTLRITYPEGAIQKMEQYEKDSLFVLAGFKWQDFKWLKYIVYKEKVSASDGFWKSVATRVPREPHEIRILNPYFIQEAAFSFIGLPFNNGLMGRGNIPTLGSVAITMALHNCDEVAVAGFGYDMSSPNAPLHYYENIKMSAIKESWTHNIQREKEFLRKLVKARVITDLTSGI
ncbi:CMP-N-acetylneuraminate-beta-1,4-galactoside alpha-2,3-sialyltransferase isoform X2 [Zonotrichia leucophrys gambelii]|uniref:CMP-N-acetylneuraminate-beta-1,4-galactoside alpha-2,3-sialyltransferase isoform X2 n=1 Tax=Zonotrichia leucophrys gambelii TaxID=257770 RepID=UPI003140B826